MLILECVAGHPPQNNTGTNVCCTLSSGLCNISLFPQHEGFLQAHPCCRTCHAGCRRWMQCLSTSVVRTVYVIFISNPA